MKNLLLYYIKKRSLIVVIISILTLIFSMICTAVTKDSFHDVANDSWMLRKTYLNLLTSIFIIYALLIPIFEFSFKMNKRSIDLFYSLPLKKEKLYLTKFLLGLIELFIVFTVSFIFIVLHLVVITSKGNYNVNLIYYLYYYLIVLGFGSLLYSWVCFFFTKGNTIIDGIILTVLSFFVLQIIAGNVIIPLRNARIIDRNYPYLQLNPFDGLVQFTNYFDKSISASTINYIFNNSTIISIVIMTVLSISLIPLLFITNNLKKAEDTSDINNEWYTYKLLLPIYSICLYSLTNLSFYYLVIMAISSYIGYIIYNRSFKIKLIDLILLLSSNVIGFILYYINH